MSPNIFYIVQNHSNDEENGDVLTAIQVVGYSIVIALVLALVFFTR